MSKRLPGPRGLPFFGVAFSLGDDVWGYAESLRTYGDVVQMPMPMFSPVYLLHPDHVGRVLQRNKDNYVRGRIAKQAKFMFGEGLLMADGERWRRQRLRMAPAFQTARINALSPGFARRAAETLSTWTAGEVREINRDMMSLTLEITLEALFGTTGGDDVPRVSAAFQTIAHSLGDNTGIMAALPRWIPTPANLRIKRALAELESVVSRILAERRALPEPGEDLLGRLLQGKDESGEVMDDALLRDEIRILLIAGHETTAGGLTFASWLLAKHPEIQEAAAAEVAAVTNGGPVLPEHTPKLGLLEQIWKETLRLYPPVPFYFREALAEDQLGEHTLPKGSVVVLSPWMLHHDARFFPDPWAFKPERWTPEMEAALPKFAYFPFGGGPQICIGMGMANLEAKLILGELLRRFRLETVDGGDLKVEPALTLRPVGPVRLRVSAR